MIRYLEHININQEKWDNCIENSLNSMIYAKSWYLDIVSPGWNCIEVDDYKAVFPLPVKKKYNIRYVYPPYFVQQLGLFFIDESYNNENTFNEIINHIPSEYKFIQLNLNEANHFSAANYEINKRKNIILNLNNKYENIYRGYSHGLKSNLKSAEKNKIKIINSSDTDLFLEFYKKSTGEKLNKFKKEEYKILAKLIKASFEKKCAEINLTYHNDDLIAGAVFLFHKDRVIYLLSSSTGKGKKMLAMPLLLDKTIREYSNKQYIFDFEGSMVEGIAKFFRSFGSVESVYLQLKINRLPRLIRWLKE